MGGFSYLWCQASLMFLLQLPLVPSQFDIFISATFVVKPVSLMFLLQLPLVSSQFDVSISATFGVKSV